MADRQCLVIDDVERTLATMSAAGRGIVEDGAALVRRVVLQHASRRRWHVVRYDDFAAWASDLVHRSRQWLVLDPLFPIDPSDGRCLPFRIARASAAGGIRRYEHDAVPPLDSMSVPLALLDDAAASGGTLRYVAQLATQSGVRIARAALCASTRSARDALQMAMHVGCVEYVPGDWRILDLRDGCPHLPFTGRAATYENGDKVYWRVPMSAVPGNVWQVLLLDSDIKEAIAQARRSVGQHLQQVVGGDPTIMDLQRIGPNIPALVLPHQRADAQTPLSQLIEV